MKRCKNCGAVMPDSANWCSQCGMPFEHNTVGPEQGQPGGGAGQQPHAQQPYDYYPPQNGYPPMPEHPKRQVNTLTVALWVVAALLVVAIILFLFTRNNGSETVSLADTTIDSTLFSDQKDPLEDLDRQREEARQQRETVRVIEEEQPMAPEEVHSWRQRTINANYYDSTGEYPVKVKFEEDENGEIRNCSFVNVNYGTTIPLRGSSTGGGGYSFSGSSGGTHVTINFQSLGGGSYQGHARIGDKEVVLTATMY